MHWSQRSCSDLNLLELLLCHDFKFYYRIPCNFLYILKPLSYNQRLESQKKNHTEPDRENRNAVRPQVYIYHPKILESPALNILAAASD